MTQEPESASELVASDQAPGPAIEQPAEAEAAAEPSIDPVERFYHLGPGADALVDPTPFGDENALQKLGKPPFERSARSKFRLVGYLATVYEHVTEDVGGKATESNE